MLSHSHSCSSSHSPSFIFYPSRSLFRAEPLLFTLSLLSSHVPSLCATDPRILAPQSLFVELDDLQLYTFSNGHGSADILRGTIVTCKCGKLWKRALTRCMSRAGLS